MNDEYYAKAVEVCPMSSYGHDMAGDDCCRLIADALRDMAAKALFDTNACYQLHGVPVEHVASIEIRKRAVTLRDHAL